MFTKIFWQRSAERAVKTFAQAFVTIISADQVAGFFDASTKEAVLAALFATLLSFLTSLASTTVGDGDSPSLIEGKVEEQVVDKIEAGEPVGDPAKIVEPAAIVHLESADAAEAPVKAVRRPRKKAGPTNVV